MEMKCDCCGKKSSMGVVGEMGKGKTICWDCVEIGKKKLFAGHFGFLSSEEFIAIILK